MVQLRHSDPSEVLLQSILSSLLLDVCIVTVPFLSRIYPTNSVPAPGSAGRSTGAVQVFSVVSGNYDYIVTIIAPECGDVINAKYLLNTPTGFVFFVDFLL